jgi:tRNA(Ile)-lysidine synthetase-like protein
VRPRQAGDRLRPLGLPAGSKSLKRVFSQQQIPATARGRWPVVCAADRVLWVPGGPIAADAAVEPGGQATVRLTCRYDPEAS